VKQVKFYLDEERYEKLRKLAEEQGFTVPAYVKRLVLRVLGELEPGLEEVVRYLKQRDEQLRKEVGRIEMDLADLMKRVEKLERELRRKPPKAA